MDSHRKRRLETRGWVVGNAEDLLGLSAEERRYVQLKLALRASLREERGKRGMTQAELAARLGSSQSRVAKMEAGDPTVSIDLLLRALLALGMTNAQIARVIG
ncbi:helix-turn-helix domain-containing protein [bacterium]|nr:helix-turn-helix domain-containing protein [bacterium]